MNVRDRIDSRKDSDQSGKRQYSRSAQLTSFEFDSKEVNCVEREHMNMSPSFIDSKEVYCAESEHMNIPHRYRAGDATCKRSFLA